MSHYRQDLAKTQGRKKLTTIASMSVQKPGTGPAHGPRVRRQNHSCDQCRKSKRACDAANGQRSPCSYCARTRKRCTMEWARSRAQRVVKPRQRLPERLDANVDGLFPWLGAGSWIDAGSGTWDQLLKPIPDIDLMPWQPSADASSLLLDDHLPASPIFNDGEAPQREIQAEAIDSLASGGSASDLLLPDFPSTSGTSNQQLAELELDMMCDPTWSSPAFQPSQTCTDFQPSTSARHSNESPWIQLTERQTRWTSPGSLSPFSIEHKMITTSNNHLTSANLLQIYHDVLEHNLSCWLTETTCPYQRGWKNQTDAVPEWGSSWSNRIYQRTIKLDRAAQSCKILQLSPSEDQAACRALHLAIMAFATQWAQGSHRHRERYPTSSIDDGGNGMGDGIAEEFDRVLQNHFWDQAQRALQRVADVESYRVAGAELIFGLTQRPWNAESQNANQSQPPGYGMQDGGDFESESVLSQVRDIIRNDGPPVYMESAARKMHALKYRCDALERGLSIPYAKRKNSTPGITSMGSDDRATIGLLYWLAIMFDTVSSSMNERPVVVLDEDCQHEAEREAGPVVNSDRNLASTRWDLDLFVPGGVSEMHPTHWPCSYEVAAENVIKSAPVKVLLFRHLSYLQNAVRKGAHEAQIEDIIRSTTSLYQYWNKTHGAFFAELVQDYSAVPQRIQGWFVCISAHWHLAALMLADLLEFVDEDALGMEEAGHSRISNRMARTIRNHSARELSNLARVATPAVEDSNLGVPQMSDFHHAVNEGTLLTEPWTIILIRAFTKACVIFLGEGDDGPRFSERDVGNDNDCQGSFQQAEQCIKALWLLGKKSDMARRIAGTLSLALSRSRNGEIV
ncbi:hypothetical protein BDW62DRAFT_187298 [Aspergillus aurantiobrunneus]